MYCYGPAWNAEHEPAGHPHHGEIPVGWWLDPGHEVWQQGLEVWPPRPDGLDLGIWGSGGLGWLPQYIMCILTRARAGKLGGGAGWTP